MLDFIQVGDLKDRRHSFIKKVENTVGKSNWTWSFKFRNKFYSYPLGLQIYEDSFYSFLVKNIDLLKRLVVDYKDVYHHTYEDFDSGLDYNVQKDKSEHYDDIAIRRSVARLGLKFNGEKILDLKTSPYSEMKVPFHMPTDNKIISVKSWFDQSRYIVVAPEIQDKVKFAQMLIK